MIAGHSLLLDTHVIIWMAKTPERLPAAFLTAIADVETRFVSHVTAWEIQVKQEKYGPRFGFSLDQLEQTMKAFSCQELAINYEDIRRLNRMQFFHSDPFDRLLMSQAARRTTYLVTLDENILKTFEREKSFDLLAT